MVNWKKVFLVNGSKQNDDNLVRQDATLIKKNSLIFLVYVSIKREPEK